MQKSSHVLSVAILYYVGTNEDDEDTLDGVRGIEKSLKRTHHSVTTLSVTEKNWRRALDIPGDIVFNFVEDDSWILYEKIAYGLEKLHRAQFGHDIVGLKFAIAKTPVKRMMKKNHINTPNFMILSSKSKRTDLGTLRFPLILKPSHQHAGIGISQHSVVTNPKDCKAQMISLRDEYPGEVIAEEFIPGREIHVTVIGNGTGIRVLPFCEIGFKGKFKNHWNVYTYDAKWAKKTWEYADARVHAPAKISRSLEATITSLALRAYRLFQCRDISRFDIRVNEKNIPFIVDINMNPSINYYDQQDATLASVYALGWTYDEFIENLLTATYTRVHVHQLKDKRLRK